MSEQTSHNPVKKKNKKKLPTNVAFMFNQAAFQMTTQRRDTISWFADEPSPWDTFSL